MGWLRLVGSIKLQVSFVEYHLFYRALLQKRPIILSILLTKATPYHEYKWRHFISYFFFIMTFVKRSSKNPVTYALGESLVPHCLE